MSVSLPNLVKEGIQDYIHAYTPPGRVKGRVTVYIFTGAARERVRAALSVKGRVKEIVCIGRDKEYQKMVPFLKKSGIPFRFVFAPQTESSVELVRRLIPTDTGTRVIASSLWHIPRIDVLCRFAGIQDDCTLVGGGTAAKVQQSKIDLETQNLTKILLLKIGGRHKQELETA